LSNSSFLCLFAPVSDRAQKLKEKSAKGFFDFEMSKVTFRYTSESSKPDRSARFALPALRRLVATPNHKSLILNPHSGTPNPKS
jgi:hypothetical protein